MPDVIRFGVLEAPALKPYAITNFNGTTCYVYFASVIRVISEVLHVRCDVREAKDGKLGYKEKADGNWSGLFGMVARSEVDVAIYPLDPTADIPENVHFSYPYGVTDITFMTNKPEPVAKSSAIVQPFSCYMWIALVIILIVMPILFYFLMKRKVKYQAILFNIFGNLLEQSFNIELVTSSTRMLLAGWILGVMIISYGYKAVLLSSLTIPGMSVIRDIPDLGRAANQRSVTCFTAAGFDNRYLTDSDIESWRAIGACLKRNEDHLNDDEFYDLKSKKVYIRARRALSYDEKDYFISKDSFGIHLFGFLLSKNFCCSKRFNTLIHQINAYGLYNKFLEEDKFFWQFYTKNFTVKKSVPSTLSRKILFEDISGAFILLICGWLSAFLTLVGEIFMKKYTAIRK